MVLRAAVALVSLLAVAPALAEPMNAEAARRFVAGKLFAFTCFEGSTGHRAASSTTARSRASCACGGNGPTRFMHLPPGTLFPRRARDLLEREGRVLQSVLRPRTRPATKASAARSRASALPTATSRGAAVDEPAMHGRPISARSGGRDHPVDPARTRSRSMRSRPRRRPRR